MNPHEWFLEHQVAFVARALEPDEEASFRTHLTGCAECREAVVALERDLAWLPMGAAPVAPPPGMPHRLIQGVLAPRRLWQRAWPIGLAASIGLFAGGGLATLITGRHADTMMAGLNRDIAAVRDTLSITRAASWVAQAKVEQGGKSGMLMIFADARTHRWNVILRDVPAAPAGQVYQFWFITDQGMVRSVEFTLDQGSPGFVTLPMPPKGGNVMGAALSVEASHSQGAQPQGPMLVHLML
ncbi:MAG: anti-sigma factor [Gemmatimonadota bacterium]